MSSFLTLPGFESEFDTDIPAPIAPARPSSTVLGYGTDGTPITASDLQGVPYTLGTDTATPLYVGPALLPDPNIPTTSSGTPAFNATIPSIAQSTIDSATSSYNPLTWVKAIENYISTHAEDAVTVVVGLLLIAAGLFAFKATQTVISGGGVVTRSVGKRLFRPLPKK